MPLDFLFPYRHIYYLLLCFASLLSFALFGLDKYKAKKGAWRISERTLLLSALLFGGIGAYLGMHLFRHKTKHAAFRILVPFFAGLEIALLFYFFYFS